MKKSTIASILCGSIPFIALVLMLPLVNTINPVILGLPFILFWIFLWVLATPGLLYIAYLMEKRANNKDKGGVK